MATLIQTTFRGWSCRTKVSQDVIAGEPLLGNCYWGIVAKESLPWKRNATSQEKDQSRYLIIIVITVNFVFQVLLCWIRWSLTQSKHEMTKILPRSFEVVLEYLDLFSKSEPGACVGCVSTWACVRACSFLPVSAVFFLLFKKWQWHPFVILFFVCFSFWRCDGPSTFSQATGDALW